MNQDHQKVGFDLLIGTQSVTKTDSKDGKDGKEGKDDGCSGNWMIYKGHQIQS